MEADAAAWNCKCEESLPAGSARWSRARKPLTCLEITELEPRPGPGAAHGRSPTRVIFTRIIAAMGEMKAIRGEEEGGGANGRIPDFWFRARGARSCVGLRQEGLKDPGSDSVRGFYARGAEPEPCLASPLPLRSDRVEPQSCWWGGRGWGGLNTECERSVR